MNNNYDYIIAGAGCAGLSLVMRMISSGKFSEKKILLVDRHEKNINDRTWCFWEKGKGLFEPVVFKRWEQLWFHANGYSSLKQISPFEYKMIRGIDFYDHCFNIIRQQKNIELLTGNIESSWSDNFETFVIIDEKKITADYVFNSIIFNKPELKKGQFYLLQHFKGWVVETKKKSFNPEEATLMDFRVSRQQGNSFVYIMPFSTTKALVEYTSFSEKMLKPEEYEAGLRDYMHQFLGIGDYHVTDQEFGVIPMTNYHFPLWHHHIINIGSAGGMTKGSSGYTFQFIQKQTTGIVNALLKTGKPFLNRNEKKFHFYDSVLLNVLATGKLPADKIFTDMFSRNDMADIFNFLDNESTILQDIRIIKSLPVSAFLHAAWQQLF